MKLLSKEDWHEYLASDDYIGREYDRVRYACFCDGEDVDIFSHIYGSSEFSSFVYSEEELDVLYNVLSEDLGFSK